MELKPFVIDREDIICLLFEELYGESVYTLTDMEDAHFRVPDFGPDLVLVAATFYQDDKEKVEELFDTQIPVVLVGFSEEIDKVRDLGWQGQTLLKPLNSSSLIDDIEKLFSQLKS